MNIRVGMGYDVHQLAKDRPLFLGGVRIPYKKGLLGHSDADVLLHAIADAVLGAAGCADIGCYFSNSDPKWKGVYSIVLLGEVRKIIAKKKFKVVNVDSVLLSEEPKIASYIAEMKKKISKALGISPDDIGIKATTTEKMGFVGRKEGMAAYAVALVKK